MANKAPDKLIPGPKLDALTAKKVSAGRMFTTMKTGIAVVF